MAGLAHDQLYSNEPQSSLHPQYWPKGTGEEDDDAVLDDHILDSSSFDVTTMDSAPRRESFASSASLVSPRQNVWPEFAYNNDATPTGSMSTPAPQFLEHAAVNPYSQTGPPHYPNYGTHMASWHPQGDTGSDASNMAFVAFASDLDNIKPEESFNKEMPPPPQHSMYGGLPIASVPDFNQYAASAASPQWSTSSSDNVEKIPRSGQFQSPSFNHNQLHLRRDGVRKKNARFEIPAGRDVNTIDAMINSTDPNDEETIKELKQQKRLLRNRQAALDSRCRKKHHTEKLEEEKKQFIAIIDRLEDEERNWRLQEQRWLHERQQWHQYTENLVKEKEELVRQHTLETADLRRRNACLADEAQRLESVSMSAQPSSSGGSAGFPEFEHLTMDTSPFDDFSFIDTPIMDTDSKEERGPVRQRKAEGSPSVKNDDNKSAASGLLLMLLLCGAWVASNHSPSSPPTIPRMPDDVRVASSTILENIYKDAGLEFGHTSQSLTDQATTHQAGSLQSHETPSPLASLHNRLMAPTPLQQRDQVFSLTTEQYNRVTCDDLFDEEPEASPHPRRRNLGEALAAMRAEKPGPAGEVYTRSLMLNELPANVVRDFARMVAENGKLPGNGESIS